jgi:hypothetical protein
MAKPETNPEATICPFMNHPFPDCYCVRSEPLYIDKVLSLCGGNYGRCDIYCQRGEAGSAKEGDKPDETPC